MTRTMLWTVAALAIVAVAATAFAVLNAPEEANGRGPGARSEPAPAVVFEASTNQLSLNITSASSAMARGQWANGSLEADKPLGPWDLALIDATGAAPHPIRAWVGRAAFAISEVRGGTALSIEGIATADVIKLEVAKTGECRVTAMIGADAMNVTQRYTLLIPHGGAVVFHHSGPTPCPTGTWALRSLT